MNYLIKILLVALSLSSCMKSRGFTEVVDVLPRTEISVGEAAEIVTFSDEILSQNSMNELGDLDDVLAKVSKVYGSPVSSVDLVSALKMTKNLSQLHKPHLRVTDKLINVYADGEYGWISRALK